jgi:hypothetical protein
MAQFTVTVNAYTNLPPDALGFNTVFVGDPADPGFYIVTADDLTTDTTPPYNDPEGDAPLTLKVVSLPPGGTGTLWDDGVQIVSTPHEISWADIIAGNLKFIPDIAVGTIYQTSMSFNIADIGSASYGAVEGQLIYDVSDLANEPATIGDGEATMDYQGTLVFTRAMFTTGTTPAYSDPEGDSAFQLKVLSLPLEEGMKLNGVDVVVNQIINFTDIDLGLFTYTNDDHLDTDGDVQNFTFAIADEGSGEFVT